MVSHPYQVEPGTTNEITVSSSNTLSKLEPTLAEGELSSHVHISVPENLSTKSWRAIRSIKPLSHLPNLLVPHPTLSILESRIAFQSPIKTSRFESSWNGANRRKKKKKSFSQRYWTHKPRLTGT